MLATLLPTTCTAVDPCTHFFLGMGFRPALYALHRDQYGDKPILIVAHEGPLDGKIPGGDFLAIMAFEGTAGASSAGGAVARAVSLTESSRPDVEASADLPPVPLPPSAAMLLIGILALAAQARRSTIKRGA